MITSRLFIGFPFTALVCLALGPAGAMAQSACTNVIWPKCVGGDFSDKKNWAPCQDPTQARVPGPSDAAIFELFNGDLNGPYTVTISGQTTALTQINGCPVTFNLAGDYTTGDVFADDVTVTGGGTWSGQHMQFHKLTATSGTISAGGPLSVSALDVGAGAKVQGGQFSAGAAFRIHDGGEVDGQSAKLSGAELNGINSRLNVSGAATNDATIDISNSATVSFGSYMSDAGAAVLVSGNGSMWSVRDNAEMGLTSKLEVRNGGHAFCGSVTFDSDAPNDPSLVDGNGSIWTVNQLMSISRTTVTAQNGGSISANQVDIGLTTAQGGPATVNVTGTGSTLQVNENLNVLGSGTLNVTAGGEARSGGGFIGINGPANTTVSDAGSVWRVSGGLSVGDKAYGTLTVTKGGRVDLSHATALTLGGTANISGQVTVQGSGSAVDASGAAVAVGETGYGGLSIADGAQMSADEIVIGNEIGATGSIQLQGGGSALSVGNDLTVGKSGSGAVTVSAGGVASAGNVRIGLSSLANAITVSDAGSVLQFTNVLEVGGGAINPAKASPGLAQDSLNIVSGAALISKGGTGSQIGLGMVANSQGVLSLSGAGSKLLSRDGVMIVGVAGLGVLSIGNGAQADISRIAIGASSAANSATVSGSGSGLSVRDLATVGGVATPTGAGSFAVINGAAAQIDHKLLLYPQGVVQVSGGYINVGPNIPSVTPPVSTLLVSVGGILSGKGKVIGRVLVANGGFVRPGGSDGTLTVQGDYTQQAGAELALDVGGVSPDAEYDVLSVTGNVSLAGQLTLNFINGFAPQKNQSFAFIKSGTNAVGQFDRVQINGLAPGFQYHFQQGSAGAYSLVADNDGVAATPSPGPLLSIARTGAEVVISWPAAAQTYLLQTEPSVAPADWTTLPGFVSLVAIPATNRSQFFRLKLR